MPMWFYSDVGKAIATNTDSETIATAGTTSHTFTAKNIGTASSDRYVIVGVMIGATTFSSVTIGGNAATSLVAISSAGSGAHIAIYGLLITSGSTADIVINTAGNSLVWQICVWSLTGVGSVTPANIYTSTADNPTASVSCDANGSVISFVTGANSVAPVPTTSWTGIAKDIDLNNDVVGFETTSSGAHTNFSSTQSGLTVTCTYTGAKTGWDCGCFAAYNPQ